MESSTVEREPSIHEQKSVGLELPWKQGWSLYQRHQHESVQPPQCRVKWKGLPLVWWETQQNRHHFDCLVEAPQEKSASAVQDLQNHRGERRKRTEFLERQKRMGPHAYDHSTTQNDLQSHPGFKPWTDPLPKAAKLSYNPILPPDYVGLPRPCSSGEHRSKVPAVLWHCCGMTLCHLSQSLSKTALNFSVKQSILWMLETQS